MKEGIRQQMSEEPENSTAVVAVLSGLLAFIVILKTLLLVVLFQRREIRLFGNCFYIICLAMHCMSDVYGGAFVLIS